MTTPDASLWLRAAQQAAGDQEYPRAALYVVGTPIGNRADLSLRALTTRTPEPRPVTFTLASPERIAAAPSDYSAPERRI